METIKVDLGRNSYDISVAEDITEALGGYLRAVKPSAPVIVTVSDENVWSLYGKTVTESCGNINAAVHSVILPPGEQNKSLDGLYRLYEAFNHAGLRRDGLVAALGGGVIGDLAGFASATWMRGTDYVQIPTTLLAQVDSGIGGKTGINLPWGKNLAGAFHQPKAVLIDPGFLKTLPARELRCGMAEVIKYGAIGSKELFNKLADGRTDDYVWMIRACCGIKAGIVSRDERETGERMLLNFGHTLGHAIEKRYDCNRYNHGEAVAIGMVFAATMGEEMGLTRAGTAQAIRRAVSLNGMETGLPCPVSELMPLVETDKKSAGGGINLVLLKSIGEAFWMNIPLPDINSLLNKTENL